jgi:HEAT repeat protein
MRWRANGRTMSRAIAFAAVALSMVDCHAQEAQKKMQILIQQVLEKKPVAALRAKEIGPSANPELIKLTRNDDPGVRRVAIYCLDQTGGADASIAFTRLVLDPDSQVRAAALEGLIHHPGDVVPEMLLQSYDQSQDAYVRQQLMMVAGKVPGVSLAEIQKRHEAEKDPEAKEGLVVALAYRDDPAGKAEFINGLHAAKDRDLARYLGYAADIKAKWLVPALAPILDDKTPLVRIGVDGLPSQPEHLRACDIAVNLIAEISGQKFSFPIAGNVNYTDEQISEVKAFAEKQPV